MCVTWCVHLHMCVTWCAHLHMCVSHEAFIYICVSREFIKSRLYMHTHLPLPKNNHTSGFLSIWTLTFPFFLAGHYGPIVACVAHFFVCWALLGTEMVMFVIQLWCLCPKPNASRLQLSLHKCVAHMLVCWAFLEATLPTWAQGAGLYRQGPMEQVDRHFSHLYCPTYILRLCVQPNRSSVWTRPISSCVMPNPHGLQPIPEKNGFRVGHRNNYRNPKWLWQVLFWTAHLKRKTGFAPFRIPVSISMTISNLIFLGIGYIQMAYHIYKWHTSKDVNKATGE